jgi:carboxylesterase
MGLPLLVPGAEPFYLPGGPTGCLLMHGFTAMPDEVRWLGDYLSAQGHTVLGLRLAGHATHPRDLARTRWTDWLASVEDGLAILRGATERTVLVGLSMGGVVTLLAAACYPVAGAVALSTPYGSFSPRTLWRVRLLRWLRPLVRKPLPERHPTLPERREAGYPAYPQFPTRILLELPALQAAMQAALPRVQVPVLLVHSQADAAAPFGEMQRIYDHLGTADKEMLPLEGFDHAVVRDPKRGVVFAAIAAFVARIGDER